MSDSDDVLVDGLDEEESYIVNLYKEAGATSNPKDYYFAIGITGIYITPSKYLDEHGYMFDQHISVKAGGFLDIEYEELGEGYFGKPSMSFDDIVVDLADYYGLIHNPDMLKIIDCVESYSPVVSTSMMRKERQLVFGMIDEEAEHQVSSADYITAGNDSILTFVSLMRGKLKIAEHILAGRHLSEKDADPMSEIRKLAALAVRCMEKHKTPSRWEEDIKKASKLLKKKSN